MSILGHEVSTSMSMKVVVTIAGLMLLAALLPARSGPPTREVTLVARGMAFYGDGDSSTPNPMLEVRAGERVRVVLRNEDRGMRHDFAVPAVDVAMDTIRWDESGNVTFDVPDTPGTYEYVCRSHALMMRGIIRVY
jgi:plastocyanin